MGQQDRNQRLNKLYDRAASIEERLSRLGTLSVDQQESYPTDSGYSSPVPTESAPPLPPRKDQIQVGVYGVSVSYTSKRDNEITVNVGDKVNVQSILNDGWCQVYALLVIQF